MVKLKKDADIELFFKYDPIYSSVPEYLKLESATKKVQYIKKELVKEWFFKHKGKINAIPLNKAARELNFNSKGNSADFRFIVAKLVEEDFFPAVSCSKGYFYALTTEEVINNIDSEVSRIKGLQRRINALNVIRQNIQTEEDRKAYKHSLASQKSIDNWFGGSKNDNESNA